MRESIKSPETQPVEFSASAAGSKQLTKQLAKFLFTFSVVLTSLFVFALSCDKVPGGNDANNANNNNANNTANNSSGGTGSGGTGGGNGGGGGNPLPIGPNLELQVSPGASGYVKIVNLTNVIISATGLANTTEPRATSASSDRDRAFGSIPKDKTSVPFVIKYPGNRVAMIFVGRSGINTNNFALDGVKANCDNVNETDDIALAVRSYGGVCRTYLDIKYEPPGSQYLATYSYLGSIFDHTSDKKARGTMRCFGNNGRYDALSTDIVAIDRTTVFNRGYFANCYLAVVNTDNRDTTEINDEWVDSTGATKEVELYAIGVNVEGKAISQLTADLGLGSTLASFNRAWNNVAFKKMLDANQWRDLRFKVKVVKGSDYVAAGPADGGDGVGGDGTGSGGVPTDGSGNGGTTQTPTTPKIEFVNFDDTVAELRYDGSIMLLASGFPTVAASTDLSAGMREMTSARVDGIKRAFDVIITGGVVGTAAATGGLVIVGPGNLASIDDFSLDALNTTLPSYTGDAGRKGILNSEPTTRASGAFLKSGWNILSSFMSTATPTMNPMLPPFAFSATTTADGTKPILFCRTVVSTITATAGTGSAQGSTKLTDGQRASCYVGALGKPFTGKAADDWLKVTASGSNPFKKTVNITVAGIRTDDKGIVDIGLQGLTDDAKVGAFTNGISKTEMTRLSVVNPSASINVGVTITRDRDFNYRPPLELVTTAASAGYVKIFDKTNVVVNATGLAAAMAPQSDADDDNRSFVDVVTASRDRSLFTFNYPGSTGDTTVYFVVRSGVTTNNIALDAVKAICDNASESGDNTLAIRSHGGICRYYSTAYDQIHLNSYLGTVFNNADSTKARGTMRCYTDLAGRVGGFGSTFETISDRTRLNYSDTACSLGIVNNAGANATAEIDDAWVDDAGSTTEVTLYAIGFNFGWSPELRLIDSMTGTGSFNNAWDNAAFKQLMERASFAELKFKVKIVKAANY